MQTRKQIQDEYFKIQEPAYAEYLKIQETAFVEYLKIQEPAWAERIRKIEELDKEINNNK